MIYGGPFGVMVDEGGLEVIGRRAGLYLAPSGLKKE
jgi:hypothetical protein